MTNETVEKVKADAKKGVSDAEKAGAHAKADANADVEKVKANFGKSDVEKKVAYAKADINELLKRQRRMSRIRWNMQKLMRRSRNRT